MKHDEREYTKDERGRQNERSRVSVDKVLIGNAELYFGDCQEILSALPVADLVLTDPPYGIGIANDHVRHKHARDTWDNARPSNELFARIAKHGVHQIIWGGNYFDLPPSRAFLVWDKLQPEQFSLAMCEQAWCSFDGNAKLYRCSVLSYRKEHPTQKPVKLMEWCISHCPDSPSSVLDPFMGSGTTGVACVNMELRFIGIERERKYFDVACERIEAAQSQGRLAL